MRRLRVLFFPARPACDSDINRQLLDGLASRLGQLVDVALPHESAADSLLQDRPDIIHVFGCWDRSAVSVMRKARKRHIPVVISPLGGLQPWVKEHHMGSGRWLGQKQSIEEAAAVHLCGKLELETFQRLKWNGRTQVIKNPVLTTQVTMEGMAADMKRLYRKVIDTYAAQVLSDDAMSLLMTLLALALSTRVSFSEEQRSRLDGLVQQMDDEDWRRMRVYVHDENVEELLDKGLAMANLDAAYFDVEQMDRFPAHPSYEKVPLKDDALLSRNPLTRTTWADATANETHEERRLVTMIANLQFEMLRDKAPLSHFTDLFSFLLSCDIDEDRVNEALHVIKLDGFAARLMGALGMTLGLPEGFMPVEPVEDLKTVSKMTKTSFHHLSTKE